MHQFRRFIEEHMGGWSRSELARRAGLRTQHVSQLLNDDRDRLTRMPEAKTVQGLARAFGVSEDQVWQVAAIAHGAAADEPIRISDPAALTGDALLGELKRRLQQVEQTAVPAELDITRMAPGAHLRVGDLAEQLSKDADVKAKAGDEDLARVHRYLASLLDRAIDAADAVSDPAPADPCAASPSGPPLPGQATR